MIYHETDRTLENTVIPKSHWKNVTKGVDSLTWTLFDIILWFCSGVYETTITDLSLCVQWIYFIFGLPIKKASYLFHQE